jgi:hypothetical protein
VTARLKAASIEGTKNVRAADALAAEILERAVARSPTVRVLIRQLEASDVIVHIETARDLPAGVGGMTRFVTKRGGLRYMRITIRAELAAADRIAMLAHELHHAREVADSDAGSAAEMQILFERTGHRAGRYFETRAAQRIEQAVRHELRDRTVVAAATR